MSEDREDRTLPPTPRRLEKAREEGQVARSRELASLGVVGVGVAALFAAGPMLLDAGRGLMRAGLRFDGTVAHRPQAALERFAALAWDGGLAFAALFGVLALAALAAPLALGGWLWSPKAFAPDAKRLDPIAGLRRLASAHSWIELGQAMVKALVLGAIAAWAAWHAAGPLAATASGSLRPGILVAMQSIGWGLAALVAGLAALAAIDVPLTLLQHHRRLRMTRREVEDEQRETDGDPQLKGRIRREQRAVARRRMMSAVPRAAVVVTNPTHYAVAIDWREGLRAPRVVAKGTGPVAERIKEIAGAAGVPRLEAPALARALHRHVELEGEVPAALYQAVAQVLAWVFQVRTARARGRPSPAAPGHIDVPPGYDPRESQQAP